MLQVAYIRENKLEVIKRLSKRIDNAETTVENVLTLDVSRRSAQTQLDATAADLNALSKEIGVLFKSGQSEKATLLKQKTAELKEQKIALTETLNSTSEELQQLLYQIPNLPHDSVPVGNSEDDNEEVFQFGEIPKLHKAAKPHWELAKTHDIIDFELGNKITGSGFPVYKGLGAKLQRALISFFLDCNISFGYEEVQVPHLVNEDSAFGTGQLPDKEGQMYSIPEDNLYLIPTAEVPITNIFRNEIISESKLPVLRTGYTPCFRREAGSYGSHVRGLNRLHQFDKVEIVRIDHPENSYDSLEIMKDQIKSVIEKLELPFRIITLCGGDLGFTSALTYDFEIYSPAQDKWLEVSSVSNFETFQSNRLKIRYRNSEGKTNLAHTLNGSSLALPRVLATLIENNQSDDGIKIPKVLQPYTGFSVIK